MVKVGERWYGKEMMESLEEEGRADRGTRSRTGSGDESEVRRVRNA